MWDRDNGLVSQTPEAVWGDPQFAWALKFWEESLPASGPVGVPPRRMIDPARIPPAYLPDVLMTDIIDGGQRLRFRLVGTRFVLFGQSDPTGRYFDEIYTLEWTRYIEDLYRSMVIERRPIYTENHVDSGYRGSDLPRRTRRLMLPFSTDERTVDLCFAVQTFESIGPSGVVETYRSNATPRAMGERCRMIL